MDDDEEEDVAQRFDDAVNTTPKELEDWLATEESKSVGVGEGESVGHHSGRRIVEILRGKKGDRTDADDEHMRQVAGCVARHSKQRPDGDVTDTKWRYSLMDWGNDPLK
ncbi:DUF3140 domain-containing protein [Kineococcus sp. R86509]|uniref:DUF3140 domain-containing protein n=1 Tax=Kineococcus sp. R86509 TaxID=3093851 RepID=UPI0036D2D724